MTQTAPTVKRRDSNFELLRIVAILFVITAHYCMFFGGLERASVNKISNIFMQTIFSISKADVNIFLLTSGYFMIMFDSRRLKWGKVLTLLLLSVFYMSTAKDYQLYFEGGLTIPDIVRNMLPPSYYINIYCALYIISPFLNRAMRCNPGTQKRLIIYSMALFCLWPNIINLIGWHLGYQFRGVYTTSFFSGEGGLTFLNFVLCYLLGAYLRLHKPLSGMSTGRRIALLAAISLSLGILGSMKPGLITEDAFTGHDSVCNFAISVLVFALFADMRIGYRPMINLLAKGTLVVYLVHEVLLYVAVNQIGVFDYLPSGALITLVGAFAVIFAVWLASLAIYAVMTFVFSPVISWWKHTRLYNADIYKPDKALDDTTVILK